MNQIIRIIMRKKKRKEFDRNTDLKSMRQVENS